MNVLKHSSGSRYLLAIPSLLLSTLAFSEPFSEGNMGEFKRVSSPPTIDGKAESIWSQSKTHPIDNLIRGSSDGDHDISGYWKGLWTDTHMFLFIEVTDDKKLMDSPGKDFLDDQIEIFLTSDNNKPDSYWKPRNTNTYAYENPRGGASFESHKKRKGHEEVKRETESGWQMEIAIPFSDINISPSAGHLIGIDVQINDDDDCSDGGARDAKLSWNSLSDERGGVAYNPKRQGTATLAE